MAQRRNYDPAAEGEAAARADVARANVTKREADLIERLNDKADLLTRALAASTERVDTSWGTVGTLAHAEEQLDEALRSISALLVRKDVSSVAADIAKLVSEEAGS